MNVQYDSSGLFHSDPGSIDRIRSTITEAIERAVDRADAEGAVVAMSGGIDSTVTATLAAEALGPDRVLGLSMPARKLDRSETDDSRRIATDLGIDHVEIPLYPMREAFESTVVSRLDSRPTDDSNPTSDSNQPDYSTRFRDERAIGNATARLRMTCLYYEANRRSRLVLGTANRSEFLLGYFTKHGDGAADAYPIGDLYKTEVRALAERIGVPRRVVEKEPTAGFWAGQTDAGELGAPYERIDPLLALLVDRNWSLDAIVDAVEIDRDTAETLARTVERTAHKRRLPPTPGIGRDAVD